jgi:hypothetical protein
VEDPIQVLALTASEEAVSTVAVKVPDLDRSSLQSDSSLLHLSSMARPAAVGAVGQARWNRYFGILDVFYNVIRSVSSARTEVKDQY